MDSDENNQLLPETNTKFSVPQDVTHADLDLQDDKDQALQDAYSNETAAEAVGMPEADLKEGLDTIAVDERPQGDAPSSDASADDWREHIEDMDEADKSR